MDTHPNTVRAYGTSRANVFRSLNVLPPFLDEGGNRGFMSKFAMTKSPPTSPALARTPLWNPTDPLKSLLSKIG